MSPRHARATFCVDSLDEAEQDRIRFKNAGLAPLTIASYQADFRVFSAWCEAAGRTPLPATSDTVELYIVDQLRRGRRITTLERHAIGIQHWHHHAGAKSPYNEGVRAMLAGARRLLGQRPKQKLALSTAEVSAMARPYRGQSAIEVRNSAICLFGFASALRRSSLAALTVENVQLSGDGALCWITKEKTDRKGKGRLLAVPRGKHPESCPVRALERWLKIRGSEPGPLFCHVMRGRVLIKPMLGNRITQIVQEAAEAIGLAKSAVGSHSLRAGFVTESLSNGADAILVARQTGHRQLDTLRLYERGRNVWRAHAGKVLGL